MNLIANLALPPLSAMYSVLTRARLALYRRGTFHTQKLTSPVISIGNLTTGGTGKTPLVEYVCRALANADRNICVLTRGYGRLQPKTRVLVSDGTNVLADPWQAGDEPFLLAQNLKGLAAVISDADRVAAGQWAGRTLGTDTFVLDDGFQHFRLRRDLDIVAIDALDPWGGNHLLPYGRLREPISGLARADCVVITRAEQGRAVTRLKGNLEDLTRRRPVFLSQMQTSGIKTLVDRKEVSRKSVPQPLAAFCAVGNPDSFFKQLEREGLVCVLKKIFPDHHVYRQADVDSLVDAAATAGAKGLITTAKDAVKLAAYFFQLPCHILEIQITFEEPREFLQMILDSVSKGR